MRISKTVENPVFNSYRAARVRSMFNVTEETGSSHTIDVDLPLGEMAIASDHDLRQMGRT